jgi:hypothetical protein
MFIERLMLFGVPDAYIRALRTIKSNPQLLDCNVIETPCLSKPQV